MRYLARMLWPPPVSLKHRILEAIATASVSWNEPVRSVPIADIRAVQERHREKGFLF